MTDTVTAPTSDRQLLADVHRWARTNGWNWHECWGWVNAPYASKATLAVEWENGVLIVRRGPSVFRPTRYDVDTVRQAIDLLVTLGILPAHLSSAYAAGWHDGYFADVEDETRAEIRASWSDRKGGSR